MSVIAVMPRFHDFSNLRILVVDDCRFMRVVMERMLEVLGVREIATSSSGGEGYERMKAFRPDIIFTDWEMEVDDGPSFVRSVRLAQDSPDPFVPIVMLTGYTEEGKVLQARDLGITEFLAKPVSAQELYRRIVAIIENPRPFVRTATYFGPCRRRSNGAFDGVERRAGMLEVVDI